MIDVLLIGLGDGTVIKSGLGAGPIDMFMLTIPQKTALSVRMASSIMEGFALVLGFMLGGPVFIGTVLFTALIGPSIECTIFFWDKILRSEESSVVTPVKKA